MASSEVDREAVELEATTPSRSSETLATTGSIDQDREGARLLNLAKAETKRQALVLASCVLLQVPIWGYAMTYGIFQDYFTSHATIHGSAGALGIVGTTTNGVMYLSMPFLFGCLTRRWAHLRRHTAIAGALITSLGFLLSAFSTQAWQLVITQGVIAAIGCALVYSPTTLSLNENFSVSNRALALGITLSSKNITGSTFPFLLEYLLNHHGFKTTMLIWTAISGVLSLACVSLMPMRAYIRGPSRSRKIPWEFLRHRTIWVVAIATALQSSGYGLPQTYLSSYASNVTSASVTSSTLLITLFNIPGIVSSSFFGLLADCRLKLSASTVTCISATASALAAFFFWGFSGDPDGYVLLVLFAIIYGFFAGGYSATWGGSMKEMEKESADRNEALDTGIVYGLFNGARGIGYVGGGLIGSQLLKVGEGHPLGRSGYGSIYGPIIVYTGLSTLFGGWEVLFRWRRVLHWRSA